MILSLCKQRKYPKKIALLVKNSFINFALKTKIHKLGLCPQTCKFLRFVHCINDKLFFNAGYVNLDNFIKFFVNYRITYMKLIIKN